MIDTAQRLGIAAAHAYLSKKAFKKADREGRLLFWAILLWGIFIGVIAGLEIAPYIRG